MLLLCFLMMWHTIVRARGSWRRVPKVLTSVRRIARARGSWRRVPKVPTIVHHNHHMLSTMRCMKCLLNQSKFRQILLMSTKAHYGPQAAMELLVVVEPISVVSDNPTSKQHVLAVLQQQVVHPSKNIQHGLDWVREYDTRTTNEDFMPVLTRKQKHDIKVQKVLANQSPKTHNRSDKWRQLLHKLIS